MRCKIKLFYLCLLGVFFTACGNKIETKQVDVLVIGGTTGGTSAGLQSARLGASTLIVEETPWLGGMMTAAGVSAIDGNHNLNSGIWNEFRQHLRDYYGGAAALATGWVSNTQFEPHVGDSIFKAMAGAEAKLSVVYGYYLVSVQKEGNKVIGATFENEKKQQLVVTAKVTIDATDLGDGLKMAGAAYRLGMDSKAATGESNALDKGNDIVQDLTWAAVLKDYGVGADKTIPKPEGYNPADFEGCCDHTVDGKALTCEKMLDYGKLPNNKYMINWPKKGNDIYLNVVDVDRDIRNKELQKAKNKTLCFVYYIQHELGFNHIGLADDEFPTKDQLALVPYHREGRRLKGIVTLDYNHVEFPYDQKEALYRTGVSVGDYPVDHHHKCNTAAPDLYFLPVPSFNVPLGSLIPESIDGLVVADKPISVTNLVNGTTRLQPCVLLTGQAAGALAALSVKEKVEPRNLPVRQVQSSLLDAGAYIMPLFDVKPEDKDFRAIQQIAATGIIKTTGEAYQWANRTWFYPDSTLTLEEFTTGMNAAYPEIKIEKRNNLLTIQSLGQLVLPMIQGSENVNKEEIWAKVSTRPYNPSTPVLRREVAAVLDSYLKPFSKPISHNGEFLK